MTDRELLELAAKAAGVMVPKKNGPWCGIDERGIYMDSSQDGTRCVYWNPLTDDGDALRLAVKLQIDIRVRNDKAICNVAEHTDVREKRGADIGAATRRAIVRAAAEIGKIGV